jgi:hypothetical protein
MSTVLKRDGQGTIAGPRGNGEFAPKPAVRLSWVARVKPVALAGGTRFLNFCMPSPIQMPPLETILLLDKTLTLEVFFPNQRQNQQASGATP